MHDEAAPADLLDFAADIVAAYVSYNSIPRDDLPKLIHVVNSSLAGLGRSLEAIAETQQPAVPIKKSVTDDYIVCLEDGKQFKSLKRHLASTYNMTPAEYRAKWGLPKDYPMVAPAYAAARSRLAKQMGLGKRAAKGRGGRKGIAA